MVEPGTDKIEFTASFYDDGKYKNMNYSDYKNNFNVFFFYPEDFGETITTQMTVMGQEKDLFPENANFFGISTESLEAHKFFVEDQLRENVGVNRVMPLICDQTGKISEVFGVYDKEKNASYYSCFVLDDLGTVLASMSQDVKLGFDLEEVGRLCFAVQVILNFIINDLIHFVTFKILSFS